MSRAEMREIMGGLENKAEQTWTSHQVTLLTDQEGVCRHLSEDHEVQVLQVASGEEVEFLRRELSQSLAEGTHCQNLFTTSRCVQKFFRKSVAT